MNDQPTPALGIKLAFAAVGLIAFGLFTYLRGSDFGAAAAFAVLAVSVAAYSCWYLSRRKYFWPLLAVVAAAHVILLLRVNVALPKPAIVIAPLVVLDFVAIVALLIGTDRLVPHSTDRGRMP